MDPTTNPHLPARVVCAAVKMNNGSVVPGVRHLSPDMRWILRSLFGFGYHLGIAEQGFIDAKGFFLTRAEAWKRADALGQILLYDPASRLKHPRPANQGDEGTLYSENLY